MDENFFVWTEKYRPRFIKDVVNHDEIKAHLSSFVETRQMPHLLFCGKPGTGKTTAALCLANELFGEYMDQNLLELNASDTRGIDVIRNQVKEFARTKSMGNVPFKILILDEADNLTSDAQQALRRTMEKYTRTCRFILIGNYSSKIIEPIQSRCAIFRFMPLSDEDIESYLKMISKKESVKLEPNGLKVILHFVEGDLRRTINIMQAAATAGETVSEESVLRVIGLARPEEVKDLILTALKGNFLDARKRLRTLLNDYGIAGIDLIRQIHKELPELEEIDDISKVKIAEMCGEVDFRLTEGANDEIQLLAFIAKVTSLGLELD